MIYEYEITYVGGLFVVFAMGRPQISFPTLEEAHGLLRQIAGLPFQTFSFWPGPEVEPEPEAIVDKNISLRSVAERRPLEILIELDHQALRMETAAILHSRRTARHCAAKIAG